jgi:DNA helicase II / ATP-dependent DNA helicase PcrA
MPEWQWSHYSEALFDTFEQGDNIIVQACPGAGKTRNLEHLWSLTSKPTCYLVFNKANQLEAKGKLVAKPGSNVLTLNGFGHKVLLNTLGNVEFDAQGKKVLNIIKEHIVPTWRKNGLLPRTIREQEWMLKRAVDMSKGIAMESFDPVGYDHMIRTYDLDEYLDMYNDVQKCLEISDNNLSIIDYNDQIRIPALYHCNMPRYDVVLGDEWQDASPMQNMLMQNIGAKQYVFVGDRHQSIYGFRGAMSYSMDWAKEYFKCIELPLSITYRCAKNIVKVAATIYKDIEPWEHSIDGIVRNGDANKEHYTIDTLVVCRMNKPLVALAFDLLAQDVPCHVKGRDIGDNIIRLINKQDAIGIRNLMDKLDLWQEIEMDKASRKEDAIKMQSIQDKYDTAMLFCSKYYSTNSIDVLVQGVQNIFEQGRGVCLSTVHKAKGLEAQRCFMLECGLHDFFTSKAKQAWQADQERNCKYVAVTRGKNELVYM